MVICPILLTHSLAAPMDDDDDDDHGGVKDKGGKRGRVARPKPPTSLPTSSDGSYYQRGAPLHMGSTKRNQIFIHFPLLRHPRPARTRTSYMRGPLSSFKLEFKGANEIAFHFHLNGNPTKGKIGMNWNGCNFALPRSLLSIPHDLATAESVL